MSSSTYKAAAKRRLPSKNGSASAAKAVAPSLSNSDILSSLGPSKAIPDSVREKMEGSFGMSMSDVKLFESPVVAENGAAAAASGQRIAFAPGKLDFTSTSGQTLLGHELSHVASQARGEVTGHGYLKNSSLEHKADVEGAAAASGEKLYSAGGLTPMSTDTGLSSAPMQAKESKDERKRAQAEVDDATETLLPDSVRNARDNKKLGKSLRKALDSADMNGKLDILRQLNTTANSGDDPLSEDEEKIFDSELGKFTPEMVYALMDQKFEYSKNYMAYHEQMRKENAGKASTKKSNGKTVSQEQADNDLATVYTNYSDVGAQFGSYTDLLMQVMLKNGKLSLLDRKYDDKVLRKKDNPDYYTAGVDFNSGNEPNYSLGENGMAEANKLKDYQIKRNNNNKRPWLEQKKKSWWHFW